MNTNIDKTSLTLATKRNSKIVKGIKCKIIDDTSLTNKILQGEFLMNNSYPSITKTQLKLKDIEFEVIKDNVDRIYCLSSNKLIKQDVIITNSFTDFRIASGHLTVYLNHKR